MRAEPQAVLLSVESALNRWRMRARTKGIDLENGGGPLLDLRFADGIWAFATSSQQAKLFDELVVALVSVGVVMNGQWFFSMVNACTPQSEPILGTGGEKKYVHWFRMQFHISPTSGSHGPKPLYRQKAWM